MSESKKSGVSNRTITINHKKGKPSESNSSSKDFYKKNNKKSSHKNKKSEELAPLKVISLGGLCEIGKNMTAFEYKNDIVIVDVGMAFAEETMPGVDCVIQDYTYLRENMDKVKAIILTHGHEDHIGALPFFLKEFKCPVYGGHLTIELAKGKLCDNNVSMKDIRFTVLKDGDKEKVSKHFEIEFVRVNHSIADSYAIVLRTPVGVVLHTGDFKVDYTPINGKPINLQRLGEIGKEHVLLMLCESTNIEIDGFSLSEKHVGESFQRLFRDAEGRIIVATFSSHVHRMQQIFDAAEMYGRHVCLSGRSMVNTFNIANSMGYIEMKEDTLIDIDDLDSYDDDKVVILTTGSQAEPMSALSRMAYASHKSVAIRKGDTVIISADPIPGNEKPIYRVINELYRLGAKVIYQSLADVHVSGHAYKNEIMLMHSLIKPKYFMPVHGEYRMLYLHKELAVAMGMPEENVFVMNNGDVLSLTPDSAAITDHIPAQAILIDGAFTADINNRMVSDRRLLSEDGCLAVALTVDQYSDELIGDIALNSIGFVLDDEKEAIHRELAEKIRIIVKDNLNKYGSFDDLVNKRNFKEQIRTACFAKAHRRPLVLITLTKV